MNQIHLKFYCQEFNINYPELKEIQNLVTITGS